MRALLGFFIDRHLLVNLIALGLVVLGYLSATSVPREFIPSVDTPILWITATLPGASARDIETKVTIPLEEALEELEGVDEFTTVISDNTSFTTVELYDDYDEAQIEAAEIDLRAAVDAITDFPPEMEDEPVIRQFNPARSTVIEIALQGPEPDLIEAAERLEARIERLDDVAGVVLVGAPDPEVRILVDPVLAREHGITLTDIISAVQRRNVSSTGGMLESPADRRQVVLWSRFEQPADVGDTIVRFAGSAAVRIRDVARIVEAREDTGLSVLTSGEPGVSVLVNKREDADIIRTAEAVRALVAQIPIPDTVSYRLINDESGIVANRLQLMLTNGLIGAVLVAVILLIFVRPQPALWILVGIPVVFMGALALFGTLGLSLNIMALTGFVIVLGMVVDDAVVVSERIVFKQAQGLPPRQAAIEGAAEMASPVVAAALTTILAFAPLTALGGMPGKIVWQIPLVVVIALLLSLFESFCILPAHLSSMSTHATLEKRQFMLRLERGYRRTLGFVFRHRGLTLLAASAIFFVIMGLIRPQVPFILFPQDDADRLFVKVTAPLGTPLEQTEAITAELEHQIMRIADRDLEISMGRVGHQNTSSMDKTYGEAENEALIILQFRRFGRLHTNAEWIEIIRERLQLPPDIHVVYQSEYFGPPTDQPVTVHVLSNDNALRRSVAYEIERYLHSVPGVIEIEVDERPGTPQIDLNLDYEKLARLGLDPQHVALTLTAAFHGIEASEHRDLQDTTELRVQFDPASRSDLQALLETPLRSATGTLVRLRDVVEPVQISAVSRIYHRDGFRATTVRASFTVESGLTALPFGQRMEQELFPRFHDLPEVTVFNGGEAVETGKTTGNIGAAALLAVIGIAIVIWLMLGSLLEALFVLVVIPFAIAGVFLTFFLHDKPLSMFAMMGAVGLAGVVVNASIVMVDSIHRRLQQDNLHSSQDVTDSLLDAVVERLRPILVTTLTTLGGVLPTAYGIGGYDPVVSPMSLAIGWGLAFSTLVTLFLVPVLYSLARDVRQHIGRWRGRAVT